MSVKRFNISLPSDLAIALDSVVASDGISRSKYIEESIGLHLQLDKALAYEVNSHESSFNSLRYWQLVEMSRWRNNS